jgi:nitronate monooxygenase
MPQSAPAQSPSAQSTPAQSPSAPSPLIQSPLSRSDAFCKQYNLRIPILLAPMAGACPPSLSIAVANAGGLGGCGALLMQPSDIAAWVAAVRAGTNGGFQLNLWVPDAPPLRDAAAEAAVRAFLGAWGPAVPPAAGDLTPPDFAVQSEAMLQAGPLVISSIMGLYPAEFVARMKAIGVRWFATVTTVQEAVAAEAAGADAVVAQGMEAGGHRGTFDPAKAEASMVGLFSLLPAVADAVKIPVIATGGIADARGVAAAMTLGAAAVQIGTGFLRTPEAQLPEIWAGAIGCLRPEDTMVTRAFSGRPARSFASAYVRAAGAADLPRPAPYPVQLGLSGPMRAAAAKEGDIDRMPLWCGQSASLASSRPAGEVATALWEGAQRMLH